MVVILISAMFLLSSVKSLNRSHLEGWEQAVWVLEGLLYVAVCALLYHGPSSS